MKSYQIKYILNTLFYRLLILLIKKSNNTLSLENKTGITTYCPSMSHVHFVLYL